ncbi:PLD nuclease N-terminal domain-containing protein [Paenibacillus ginsengarvi]|uniref:PLDc_N domain-containing protein n=1 Tax=Paenibacillus ginsengarvi TaxID=400777 RepID=A0A3B0CKJ5_9BACL|nr:PLD nuclease N-terminal domain-containing protein [Paenibacillus ginsengarvi]RKN84526.1 PLDc_N domain-containing protein [Paenibacillus ginsengarvi]
MHYGINTDIGALGDWLPLLIPLLVLYLLLVAVALWDLLKRDLTADHKWIWASIIVLVSFFGPILYFNIGKRGR